MIQTIHAANSQTLFLNDVSIYPLFSAFQHPYQHAPPQQLTASTFYLLISLTIDDDLYLFIE